ncbi:MAG: hypothetical protein U0236_07680 [Nitrospira sp.]
MKQPSVTGFSRSCADRLSDGQDAAVSAHGSVVQRAILTRSRLIVILGALSLTAAVASGVSALLGAQPIAYGEILRLLTSAMTREQPGADDAAVDITRTILLQIRLPRCYWILGGCSLASVGVVLQGVVTKSFGGSLCAWRLQRAALGAALGVLCGAGTTFLLRLPYRSVDLPEGSWRWCLFIEWRPVPNGYRFMACC